MLTAEWNRLRLALSQRAIRTLEGAADTMFLKITDDIRGAAQAAAGPALTPPAVQGNEQRTVQTPTESVRKQPEW